jgi:hypothetical protein
MIGSATVVAEHQCPDHVIQAPLGTIGGALEGDDGRIPTFP